MNVYRVHCHDILVNKEWSCVVDTLAAAYRRALKEIATWVDGKWSVYPYHSAAVFRSCIECGDMKNALTTWNKMSALAVDIQELVVETNSSIAIDMKWPADAVSTSTPSPSTGLTPFSGSYAELLSGYHARGRQVEMRDKLIEKYCSQTTYLDNKLQVIESVLTRKNRIIGRLAFLTHTLFKLGHLNREHKKAATQLTVETYQRLRNWGK